MDITTTTLLYHVAEAGWDGGDLTSLYSQHGEEAYSIFAARWPDAGELGHHHVHYVHLFADRDQAVTHYDYVGGDLLEIDASGIEIGLDVDEECCKHYTARLIPYRAIRII